MTKLTLIDILAEKEAETLLNEIWYGGKNKEEKRHHIGRTSQEGNLLYVVAKVPLSLIRHNENGDLYDWTCNKDRVARYALENIETPIHLLYSERSFSDGMIHAAVHDGRHRISAARINLRKHIHAVIKKDHFDLLLKNSVWIENFNSSQESYLASQALAWLEKASAKTIGHKPI